MDIAGARELVLKDFASEEYDHFGKAAYRIPPKKAGAKPGRTFMTLWIDEGYAVLMLNVEQQMDLITRYVACFTPHPSKWGQKGATIMHLGKVNEPLFLEAVAIAHAHASASKR